jgi:hypothetical protein
MAPVAPRDPAVPAGAPAGLRLSPQLKGMTQRRMPDAAAVAAAGTVIAVLALPSRDSERG